MSTAGTISALKEHTACLSRQPSTVGCGVDGVTWRHIAQTLGSVCVCVGRAVVSEEAML